MVIRSPKNSKVGLEPTQRRQDHEEDIRRQFQANVIGRLEVTKSVLSQFRAQKSAPPRVVADVIFKATTDGSDTLRYAAGDDAVELLGNRAALDDATFIGGLEERFGLWTVQAQSSSPATALIRAVNPVVPAYSKDLSAAVCRRVRERNCV